MIKSDPVVYHINSAAVGDIVASAPALKFAIERFHEAGNYMVAVYPEFRCFYPFVPDDRMIHPDVMHHLKSFAIRRLNAGKTEPNVCRLTPSRMPLIQYAAVGLLGGLIPRTHDAYVPLREVDVSRFEIDFSKAVVLMTTFRDRIRSWPAEEIVKTAEAIRDRGLIPVYMGKTGKISIWKDHPAKTDFQYPGFGINLIDQTTISEMASIMSKSQAILGMDSGPIHVAWTTQTPVVCGFTSVRPELRIPFEAMRRTMVVYSNIECRYCQSDWGLDFWNFMNCPRKLDVPDCSQSMKAESFVEALDQILRGKNGTSEAAGLAQGSS